MKSLFICIIVFFMLLGIPWFFDSVDNTLTDEYELSFAGIYTGSGVYTSNVTLTLAPWRDSAASIIDISSNISGTDAPTAAIYNKVSRLLTINGLNQNSTRTLYFTYNIASISLPDFMDVVLVAFRWLYIFIILGLEASAMYFFFQN